MCVVRLVNDCLKEITRTLRRCRLLIKMKGMKPTRELYLRRRPPTGARKSLTGPTPEKDNAANPEAPRINVHVYMRILSFIIVQKSNTHESFNFVAYNLKELYHVHDF